MRVHIVLKWLLSIPGYIKILIRFAVSGFRFRVKRRIYIFWSSFGRSVRSITAALGVSLSKLSLPSTFRSFRTLRKYKYIHSWFPFFFLPHLRNLKHNRLSTKFVYNWPKLLSFHKSRFARRCTVKLNTRSCVGFIVKNNNIERYATVLNF